MLNHVRTLLLNLSYADNAQEHIPSEFSRLILPSPLKEIHEILFPVGASRSYRQFLVHHYLNVIKAAGLEKELTTLDSRISYPLERSDFFKINRISNPFSSNSSHPVFVFGKFLGNQTIDSFYDNFEVSQVGSTDKIVVYSTVRKKYMKENSLFDTAEAAAEITLSFVDNLSVPIIIGSTGISFSIAGGATFTGSSNKTWQFLVESPFETNVITTISTLSTFNLTKFYSLPSSVDTTSFDNLWKSHYNPVYRLAGFLMSFVNKLDYLL